jgi:pyruvate formate lyase activating enzyme
MEARYFKQEDNRVQCMLCPHDCVIQNGSSGICRVRRNVAGKLMADTWGNLSAVHFDPVEKKPLYHYYPGKMILSLGSTGCNMRCKCCQNWQISQIAALGYAFDRVMSPLEIIKMAASRKDNIGIAYTYNEPTVWFEYMYDIARVSRFEGLKNVMVSNGYINTNPLKELLNYMDAFNIDLKGFSDDFYRNFTGATLAPVLETLKTIRKAGRHLEITFLVVPTENDDEGEFSAMINWISKELGNETVLHLSRYHPAYKLDKAPTSATSLENLHNIAREKLAYVYTGNIQIGNLQDTFCRNCKNMVIRRTGYQTDAKLITSEGLCSYCNNRIIIC